MQALAAFIMQGRMQQILVAVITAILSLIKLPISSPLSYLSGATVALVTLHRGGKEGLLLVVGTLLIAGLLAIPIFGSPAITVLFLLVFWLPVWVLAAVLRRTVSWGHTLKVAAFLTLGFVLLAFVVVDDLPRLWYEWLAPNIEILKESGFINSDEHSEEILQSVANLITGFVAASVMFGVIVSLIIGRWFQAILFNPGGLKNEFHSLSIGRNFTYLVIGLMCAALLLKDVLVVALAIVAFVIFLFQGLAVIHAIVDRRKAHVAWLFVLYGVMVVAFPQFVALVSMLGIMDNWLNIRARAA